MSLTDEVRATCAEIAAGAQHVRIDLDAAAEVQPSEPPPLDPERHYLEGDAADVADYMLALDAINFGSGWFPTLRKRTAGGEPVSGYFTVSWNLADHVRTHGPPTSAWLTHVSTREIAAILDQPPHNELMSLYAQALRQLGRFLERSPASTGPVAVNGRPRRALDLVAEAGGSAERLAHRRPRAPYRHVAVDAGTGTRVQGAASAPLPDGVLLAPIQRNPLRWLGQATDTPHPAG